MELRAPTAGETTVTLLGAALGIAGTAFAALVWLEWTERPGLATVAVVVMVAGDLGAVGVARALRPVLAETATLADLEPDERRLLRRELWAGRPGPPGLRHVALGWVDRALRNPVMTGFWVFLAGFNLAAVQRPGGGSGAWSAVGIVTAVVCLAAGTVHELRRRRARALAEYLDDLAAGATMPRHLLDGDEDDTEPIR
jgi:protein-S-isoprenylcysteine O-methyltransferase Ste14